MLFNETDIIISYGEDEALQDGTLVHPYPTRWPWLLVTQAVDAACKGQKGRTYDQCLTPLLMDCILAVRAQGRQPDFPVILEGTVANTVWIMPNAKGGLTVMLPSDY